MINIRDIVRTALRADTNIQSILVSTDADDEVKVYKVPVKKNVKAPYITVQTVPIAGVIPVYGDTDGIEQFQLAVTVWAMNSAAAWAILPALDTAMKTMSPTFPSTYKLKAVQRYQTPLEQEEPASRLTGVVVQYELFVAR